MSLGGATTARIWWAGASATVIALAACGSDLDTSGTDGRRAPTEGGGELGRGSGSSIGTGSGPEDLDAAIAREEECPEGELYGDDPLSGLSEKLATELCQDFLTRHRKCVPTRLDARLVCWSKQFTPPPAAASDEQARTQCLELTKPCVDPPTDAPTRFVVDCARMVAQRGTCSATIGEVRTCFAREAARDRRFAEYPICTRAGVAGGVMQPEYPDVRDLALDRVCAWRTKCAAAF